MMKSEGRLCYSIRSHGIGLCFVDCVLLGGLLANIRRFRLQQDLLTDRDVALRPVTPVRRA
jgi:hypothetical protein